MPLQTVTITVATDHDGDLAKTKLEFEPPLPDKPEAASSALRYLSEMLNLPDDFADTP